MTLALGTIALLVVLNIFGLIVSLRWDKHGVPAALYGQSARRKKGALRKRLPLIGLNLALLVVLTGPALWMISESFPLTRPDNLWLAVAQIAFIFVIDDVCFYWYHRTLHQVPNLYQRIHKIHHKAYAPVPIEYIYAHPLEWMMGTIGPVIAVSAILAWFGELNAWTFWIWGALRTLHELDIHSGVNGLIGHLVPFYGDMIHHDLHHARPNLGNYASTLRIWDIVYDTEIDRDNVRIRAESRS
ncbi:MAG TPA: hypothetical protein DCQ06_09240 [Myxococcales bacterium]|mgnify:CR=1 FL=1|nr:hypothetical protein [Myxococcales bacterium]HAN31766.1 hypothetical protein [Myxococcales bacterium]|tara:strand:+ start:1105 stop:1833 length:729 start_codon:yes stop_codon:yes gene_type:complete